MWWLTKPRIRHCSMEFAAVQINWVVDFPGELLPWPCRTWQDALDAVERWYGGTLFARPATAVQNG